jgi:epoxide hydrolase-like predicted phosphatase
MGMPVGQVKHFIPKNGTTSGKHRRTWALPLPYGGIISSLSMRIQRSMNPRAIIFDLGKVLIPFDFGIAYRRIEDVCTYSLSEIASRMTKIGVARKFETGVISPEEFVEAVTRELEIDMAHENFREIWNCIFLPKLLVPEEVIERLSARYRLVLLSNTNAMHFESIQQRYPVLRHFHHLVLSYQVGMMKPDAAIYRYAAEAAECAPEECLFIDDLAENVAGARSVGMQGIRFESFDQLSTELRARGISWD